MMTALTQVLGLLLAAATVLGPSAAVAAQAISFVASNGKDSNTCARAAPCRTLQRAHNVTTIGGEVQVLDSGNYRGTLTINRRITISGINANATVGRIVIAHPSAVVTLRRLLLNGTALGGHGVVINQARAVHIEDCEVQNFAGAGIYLNNIDAELFVTNTASHDNGDGIYARSATSGGARLTIGNSRFENNSDDGIDIDLVKAVVTGTVASGNGSDGVEHFQSETRINRTIAAFNGGFGFNLVEGSAALNFTEGHENAFGGLILSTGSQLVLSNSYFWFNDQWDVLVGSGALAYSYGGNVILSLSGTLSPQSPR